MTAVVVTVIILAVVSTWWIYLSPVERVSTLGKIKLITIYGALAGAVYALLALGFTLIYGVANVVNMAHGSFFMLGAYMFIAFGPLGLSQLDVIPALILATIFVGIVSSVVYVLTIHPIVEDELAVLVATIGVALILEQLIVIGFSRAFGGTYLAVPSFLSGYVTFLGMKVVMARILVAVISLVLFAAVLIFVTKSKIGRAMRAVAQDREVAMLMGINTTKLYMLTMAISASLAATAGIFIASAISGTANPAMWLRPLVLSFAIVILGGLGSIKGTFIGAFIVGYAENAVIIVIPEGSFLGGAAALVIMVLVLLLRPRGIFGKRIELE
ncbi:MAG: branched-chain amino acid ABC transporter permease [bacterium]